MIKYQFKDIPSIKHILELAFRDGPGDLGRKHFYDTLINSFEFTSEQATHFASIILARNAEDSASNFFRNANTICGKWTHSISNTQGNYFKGSTTVWNFYPDLTYEYRMESLESLWNPLGGGYSNPSESNERGIWAPSDSSDEKEFQIAMLTYDEKPSEMWALCKNHDGEKYNFVTMGGLDFIRS